MQFSLQNYCWFPPFFNTLSKGNKVENCFQMPLIFFPLLVRDRTVEYVYVQRYNNALFPPSVACVCWTILVQQHSRGYFTENGAIRIKYFPVGRICDKPQSNFKVIIDTHVRIRLRHTVLFNEEKYYERCFVYKNCLFSCE